MNKTKILKVILAPIGKGILIFAVFGLALYAYASIVYPPQPTPVTGVVGQFVGKTPSTYNGDRGGYDIANTLCSSSFSGSHICTPMEMINTYNNNPTAISSITDPLWLNSGAPAYYLSVSNDCLGWTTTTSLYGSPVYGSVWDTDKKYGMMTFCSTNLSFACCK